MALGYEYFARYNVRVVFDTDVLGGSAVTGAISEIVTADLDPNRALVSDSSGKIITSSDVTSTELGYLGGATSNIQNQLDGKEATLTKGNLTEATSSVLTITGGSSAIIGSGLTIQVKQATSGQAGYLSSTDWSTFNNKLTATLTDTYIFVGNGSNIATGVAVSGDIAISNTGVTSIASGVIVDADINASAAITRTKLAAGTAYRILANNASGVISENAALTASRALASDSNGQLVASATTATELGYVNGVTSAIQTQLDGKDDLIVGKAISTVLDNPSAVEHLYAIVWDNTNNEFTLLPGAGSSVTGPGSSTDNAIARWDGTGGSAVQDSGIIIDDSDNVTGVASITVGTGGLHLLDTDSSHDLIISVGSNLTADRTLTVTTGDSDRTVTLSGNPTLSDWFDQSVKSSASPAFVDITVTNAGGLHILDSDASHDLIITTSSNLTADRTLTFVPGDANRTITFNASGTAYVTGGTDVTVADGGTGRSSISALSILVANSLNTFTEVTPSAGQAIRVNAGGTAWEAYTPASASGFWAVTGTSTLTGAVNIAQATNNLTLTNGYLAIGGSGESTTRNVEMLQRNLTVANASTTAANGSNLELYRAGGATIGAGTAVSDTHVLGNINFTGYDGSSAEITARIQAIVNGTVATDQVPADLVFFTSATTTGNLTERFRINSAGVFSTPEGTLGKVYQASGSTSGSAFYGCGSTPITAIAAPGAGKYINIISVTVSQTYNSVAYDFGASEHPSFKFSGGSAKFFVLNSTVNGTSSFNRTLQVDNTLTDLSLDAITNTAFVLTTADGGDGTQGNSTFKYKIYYTIEST